MIPPRGPGLPPSRLLHEAQGIRVFHRPGRTAWSLIVLGPRQPDPQPHNWWGIGLARREEVDVIGIAARDFTWFPPAAMAELLPVIRATARPEAVAYGFSMGGYAALKYGRALGARGVLALSPQYSIDPADGTVGRRGLTYYDPALHAGMRVTPGEYPDPALLIWDPLVGPDDRHARAIAALPGIRPLPLRMAGHATPAVLAETRRIVPVAEALLAGDAARAAAIIREARRQAPTVLSALVPVLQARGRDRWAEAARRRMADARPNRARAIEAEARARARLGDAAGELRALRRWVAAAPGDLEPRLRLVETLLAAGRPALAIRAGREAIAAGLADARLHAALAEAEAALPPRGARPARPVARLLHETAGLRLWHREGEGPGTLVVLGPPRASPAEAASWWGQAMTAAIGWPALAISAHGEGGYSPAEMAALFPHLRAAAQGPLLAFGAGAGGHAALRHARAMGAVAAIAVSPLVPAAAPPDLLPEGPPPLAILAFDPLRPPERIHAGRLLGLPGLLAARLPRAGAGLAALLAEAGVLAPAFEAALEGDAEAAVAALRQARRASPRLRGALAAALDARGHGRWARALEASAPPPPDAPRPEDLRREAERLRLARRGAEEEAVLRRWIAAAPAEAEPRLRLAEHLAATRRAGEAAAVLQAAVAAGLGGVAARRRLVLALRAAGQGAEAVAQAEALAAATPGDAAAQVLLGEMLLAAGRGAEAEAAFARVPEEPAARLGLAVTEAAAAPDRPPGPRLAALLDAMQAGPAPEAEWQRLILRLRGQGAHRPALAAAERAALAHPASAPGRLRLARMRIAAGQDEAAIAGLRALVDEQPGAAEAWIGLAEALAATGRGAEARALLADAAARMPDHPGLALRQATLLLAAGLGARAEAAARRAIALAPGEEAAHLALVDALRRQQRLGAALEAARAGSVAVPESATLLMRLARMLREAGEPGAAADAFARLVALPQPPRQAWLGLTEALAEAGRAEEAEAAARRGIAAVPGFRALQALYGALVLARAGEGEAAAALASAMAAEGSPAAVALALADALERTGRRREALAHLGRAVAAMPGEAALEVRLGEVLLAEGRAEEAAALFARLVEAAPGLAPAWIGLSDAERMRRRIRPAVEAYRRAVAAGAEPVALRELHFRLFGEYGG
ncbi:thioredoxin-like negative regulator of GroEL [Roseomonas alkaliterrae]|uniref:Thioredoxin-like negative regulator of GroEL n=3 Tax=Neoroseomonas alkaliterrae TaxID=1452450 RepID=A0A840XTP7_9PROT|nr:tetratricopeptide repeat protein [Neoroseomonas alkaliterrae]MBB5690029.1 thioredoxin-like negative regulator of GroEL [Neoroseomonas alkaliterrae]